MAGVITLLDQPRTLNAQGKPTSAVIFFYNTGTTVLAPIYNDEALTDPSSNPVLLASGEIFPDIYLNPEIIYRRRIVYGDGTIHDVDPLPANNVNSDSVSFTPLGSGAVVTTVEERLQRSRQALDYIPENLRGGVISGTNVTDLTGYIQAAVDATPAGWVLDFQGTGWIMGVVNITKSIKLRGPATITLSGVGARFRFNANFDTFSADDLTFIGSGVAADDHYAFAPTSSSVVVQNATFRNTIVRNTTNGIDCSAMVNFRVEGGKIGPTVPATSPGPGQGYGVAGGTNSKIGVVTGVHFYRCSRHSIYMGACNTATVMGNTIEEHAFGTTPTLGNLAALAMARGSGNTAVGNHFLNCVTCPVEITDETTVLGQASAFLLVNNEFRGCLQPSVIGSTAPIGVDQQTNDVTISGNIWVQPAGSSEVLRIFQGTGIEIIGNRFSFVAGDVAATAITLDDVIANQPTYVKISGNNMFSSPSSGTSSLTYVDTALCGSGSTAAIDIKNNSLFGTAILMITATPSVQNSNLTTDTISRKVFSSGTTPAIAGYKFFEISYGSPTTITNFLNPFEGQEIELYFTNANVTLSNANFYLAGGVNFAATANDVLKMQYILGAWRETGRSVN